MKSKDLRRADDQSELPLARRAEPNDVPIEMIRRQRTAAAAFALACQSSGLEDKEIYGGIGIDAGYFSRIKAGTATLQAEKIALFCDIVANRIYPEWCARTSWPACASHATGSSMSAASFLTSCC